MNYKLFFLLLLLLPTFIFGDQLSEDYCKDLFSKGYEEWKQVNGAMKIIKTYSNDPLNLLPLINDAIVCCQNAIGYYNAILNEIAECAQGVNKKKKKRWHSQLKKQCETFKTTSNDFLNDLNNKLNDINSINNANALYLQSFIKADSAQLKEQEIPRTLNNLDKIVDSLDEAAKLYDEALSIANNALKLIPSSYEVNKSLFNQTIQTFQDSASRCRNEKVEWLEKPAAQKAALIQRLAVLRNEYKVFEDKGLKRAVYEVQKQMVLLLKQLLEKNSNDTQQIQEELAQLKIQIALFEANADANRLTEKALSLSTEEFKSNEKERVKSFFKNDLLLNPKQFFQEHLCNEPRPTVIALDGQVDKNSKNFTLYTEQFYRFLVHTNTTVTHFFVQVHQNQTMIFKEKITLPIKNTPSWEQYLTTDGLIYIPETKLKNDFGFDLRLRIFSDENNQCSLIIAQKGSNPETHLSISLDESSILYTSSFIMPPPWQLEALCKPTNPNEDELINNKIHSQLALLEKETSSLLNNINTFNFPILDNLVDELKQDPLLISQYVHNEIALVDPFLHQENGVFFAPSIHRNPCMTFLEKQGSPWEQCQLLVYLLKKAGYQAIYAKGLTSLPKSYTEKMLFTQQFNQEDVQLKYPWVLLFDGKEWISLFPWMKETQIEEGYDLYNLMSEEFASADRWLLHYLKRDERILKHIGPDENDTAGILFVKFVEEELRKKGLSIQDVGTRQTQMKKQFSSWKDFPRPIISEEPKIHDFMNNNEDIYARMRIEVFSHEHPEKEFHIDTPLVNLTCNAFFLQFSPQGDTGHSLNMMFNNHEFGLKDLGQTDHNIDIKITYQTPQGSTWSNIDRTFSIVKGTTAAICFTLGGTNQEVTSQFYQQFANEKNERKRLHALLAFIGTAYFEKCISSEKMLACLHKVSPKTVFGFGLAKLSPDITKETIDLKYPQVDMFWCHAQLQNNSPPFIWHQEIYTANKQFQTILNADRSSNEHQILRELFSDPYAISTVKLLQLAHLEHQKKGLSEPGFLIFSPHNFQVADNTPEIAQNMYFSQFENLNLRDLKLSSQEQWKDIKTLLEELDLSDYAYAYMTPGSILNQNGTYKETGSLIFHPNYQHALISSNTLILNGGLGSPIPAYLDTHATNEWQVIYTDKGPTIKPVSLKVSEPSLFDEIPIEWKPDVRLEHKTWFDTAYDPVDIVSGAFYIDELDLMLPGSFPLKIRRNYNSQNPIPGIFGCGWKLSLNPFLVEQDEKRYVAEEDGTVIVYSYNEDNSRWEVNSEDNPNLSNYTQQGIGSAANPFHAYIENDILYGADGSKRIFEAGLLKKWINASGNVLTFIYDQERLSQIESSNGNFCGFHYNHEGKISEIYAKDGRRISYTYNYLGDLIKVTLPNTATITYEYDRFHRIIRETKPHGRVLENKYDDQGRVKEQRTPSGQQQEMITTGYFDYQDGITTIEDAKKSASIYKYFNNQIYKIIDPQGGELLYSWYIDDKSWFDPVTETIVNEKEPHGYEKSLKSSTDKRGLTTYYLYDTQGNPKEIGLIGEDLTGDGQTTISKRFVYNDQNLCIEEETAGQKTITTYDSIFPYLPKRIEKYSKGKLLFYNELEYNTLGQVVKEDHSGAITLWKYDSRGFPIQKIQLTGTEDPDVVSEYAYNHQGQCIQAITADSIQESEYDIMGNQIQSHVYSKSGTLLSAAYARYNLNNELIWKRGANPKNVFNIDYHATGVIKATRHQLSPTNHIAYTLYDYDSRGLLVHEVNPLGNSTYRDYDSLGRLERETKEGLSTLFSYEIGGMVKTITTPSGATTSSFYTTNGLLKEEIYPDGTKQSVVYDFFGRVIKETKNNMTWEIKYDDANRQVYRTHSETKITSIQESDARGNLIRSIDAAGSIWEQTYDGLGRIKTETTPTGEVTYWNYEGDTVTCKRSSGEKTLSRYEGNRLVESKVFDSKDTLIEYTAFQYDPETDIQKVIEGDQVITTWMNALEKPIKVQQGALVVTHQYDACGNCLTTTDGEGRVTKQTFDPLHRLVLKELPDGSQIRYDYDLDSNLIECQLPNNISWKATYDHMGRKTLEKLQASGKTSERWEYTYYNGHLTQKKDPMQRVHAYQYDSYGRLVQENLDGWQRTYTYDLRGSLASVDQVQSSSNNEHSHIQRSYDESGRLISENIFLNSELLQQSHQAWKPASRTLKIGKHEREFTYQNSHLSHISTNHVDLSYTYDLSGALKNKITPLSSTTLQYNASSLPESIHTKIPEGAHEQILEWDQSGKLTTFSGRDQEQQFAYTSRGHLQSSGKEKYAFDFGQKGPGIRTEAPNWHIPQNGLDAFGKVISEVVNDSYIITIYDRMGQVVSRNDQQFEWDPWGRLLKVADKTAIWEASYDAFGRRLQTRYTPSGNETLTTTSLYDPQEEFQEIGVRYGDETFWKIYGPNSCDALVDEGGNSVFLTYNVMGQLTEFISRQGTLVTKQPVSSFGPLTTPSYIEPDLIKIAQSMLWRSMSQDPTGLIWMGERYYHSQSGRFISPDPIGYPYCLDLYAYANGDPINYHDPDGRYGVYACKATGAYVIDTVSSPRFQGGMQAIGGAFEVSAGAGLTFGTGGMAAPVGAAVAAHGFDHFLAGMKTLVTGKVESTYSSQALQMAGMSQDTAEFLDNGASFVATLGSAGYTRYAAKAAANNLPRLASIPTTVLKGEVELNRFNQAASCLTKVGKDNIRILRGWAKSKGWKKLPNPTGGPEIWGKMVNKKFQWHLKIKPEASFRHGLQTGSNMPRFDARLGLGKGQYINPLTGQLGGAEIGTHIPLEIFY